MIIWRKGWFVDKFMAGKRLFLKNSHCPVFICGQALFFIILAGLCCDPVFLKADEIPVSIIPRPAEIEFLEGRFVFNKDTVINADEKLLDIANQFSDSIFPAMGFCLRSISENKESKNIIHLSFSDELKNIGEEGYKLSVTPDGIKIDAFKKAGIFYGLQTLRQLFPSDIYSDHEIESVEWSVPSVNITDKPCFEWRGMMLDTARYYFSKDFIKKYLDLMAMHKLNTLHWHLTDDAGWRIEIKKYPMLTEVGAFRGEGDERYGGYYTQDDIREIVQYAGERFIKVVPEIEMPAHSMAAVAAYPDLSCRSQQVEVPTVHFTSKEIFCAGGDFTYEFLEGVLKEVMELFPSKLIHIGGEEVDIVNWRNCEKCKAKMEDVGLKNADQLRAYFFGRVAQIIEANDFSIVGWAEILEGKFEKTPIVMPWLHPAMAFEAAQQNGKIVMALTSNCFFDTPESSLPGEVRAAFWIPPVSLEKAYEWDPVLSGFGKEQRKCVLGAEGCVWTDHFLWREELRDKPGEGTRRSESHVEYLSLPRMAALAETTWTPASDRETNDFRRRMAKQYRRYENGRYNFRVPLPVFEREDNIITFIHSVEDADICYTLDGWNHPLSPRNTNFR